MKWKVKKEPKDGDERWCMRFTWWPVNVRNRPNNIEDRYWVWLEFYSQYQRYKESYDVIAGVNVMRWVTIENYIIKNRL